MRREPAQKFQGDTKCIGIRRDKADSSFNHNSLHLKPKEKMGGGQRGWLGSTSTLDPRSEFKRLLRGAITSFWTWARRRGRAQFVNLLPKPLTG